MTHCRVLFFFKFFFYLLNCLWFFFFCIFFFIIICYRLIYLIFNQGARKKGLELMIFT